MKLISLDQIVMRTLIHKRLTNHWYLEFLSYAAECLREKTWDTFQTTKSVLLTLNSYYAITLPCDFESIVGVGIQNGQFAQPVTQRNGINDLSNLNSQGQPIPYGTLTDSSDTFDNFPSFPGYFLFQNTDSLGENLGRLYGLNTGLVNTSYKYIKGRNQIQFSEDFPAQQVVLEYLYDGECPDNATKVPSEAFKMIQTYIDWQWKVDARKSSPGEVMMAEKAFSREWRYTRARIANIGLEDIRQSILKSYNGAIKT
jgi:hypothetical protein